MIYYDTRRGSSWNELYGDFSQKQQVFDKWNIFELT